MATRRRKTQIFFARTYRRLHASRLGQVLYLVGLMLPLLVIFLLTYSRFTELIAIWAGNVLSPVLTDATVYGIDSYEYFPWFGPTYYTDIQATMPATPAILITAAICLALAAIFAIGPLRGLPLSIYLEFGLTIQLISCVFFLVGASDFPYEGADYSRLYIQQQVGIWLFFLIISALVTGLISYGHTWKKLLTFICIMAWSFVFGIVRYVVYLYVIAQCSMLYMALLFFPLGPFWDYLYLVFIYSIFVDSLNKTFGRRDAEAMWRWT